MGGWPTFLLNLTQELSREFDFHFIATENKEIHPRFNGLGKVQYLGTKKDKIKKYLQDNQIDIVQYGNKAWPGEVAKDAGVPVIIERTAGPRSCHNDKPHVTHVVASSIGTVPLIRTKYSGPISVIRNGLQQKYYDVLTPSRHGFKDDDFVICYCARIGGVGQGHATLIKAVLQARKKHPNIKLLLVGDKPKHAAEDVRPKLRKLAEPMGDDCVFAGAMDNPAFVITGCDLYVCPARHHGISNSLIEAAAAGRPIIATDVGQTNEIVHEGHNGVLVPPNDVNAMAEAIVKMVDLPKQRERFGHYGKGLVARDFDIVKQAELYKQLYYQLLNQK